MSTETKPAEIRADEVAMRAKVTSYFCRDVGLCVCAGDDPCLDSSRVDEVLALINASPSSAAGLMAGTHVVVTRKGLVALGMMAGLSEDAAMWFALAPASEGGGT